MSRPPRTVKRRSCVCYDLRDLLPVVPYGESNPGLRTLARRCRHPASRRYLIASRSARARTRRYSIVPVTSLSRGPCPRSAHPNDLDRRPNLRARPSLRVVTAISCRPRRIPARPALSFERASDSRGIPVNLRVIHEPLSVALPAGLAPALLGTPKLLGAATSRWHGNFLGCGPPDEVRATKPLQRRRDRSCQVMYRATASR